MSLVDIHANLANTTLYYAIILALWGLWRVIRKQGVGGSYLGALLIGEILIIVQGLLGVYLWLSGGRPDRSIHILYGIVAAIIIPGIYAYTKGDQDRRVMLIYGFGLLAMVGIIIRGIMTAG